MTLLWTRRSILAAASTLAVSAVTGAASLGPARAADKIVRVGYQKYGTFLLLKARGNLERKLEPLGFGVSWTEFPGGPQLLEALDAGSLDFGTTGEAPPVFAQAGKKSLVYVGTEGAAPTGEAILVPKDSPIRTVADLKGKKVALNKGSNVHYLLVAALASAGLTPKDIQSVFLAPADARAAFDSSSIDAWAIWDPFFAVAEADPLTRVLTTSEGLLDNWGYFLGNGSYTGTNPDAIVDVIDELAKVGAAAQADLDGTVKALAAITGVPADITRVTLTRSEADLGKISLFPDAALTYQQALADDFHKLGIVPKQLKVSDIVWHPKAS